jgi:tetratricopeptide (TPR) repeat protein
MSKAYYIITPITLLFSFLTYQQSATWQSSASLWDHTIKINPSSRAYDNRAQIFRLENNYDKAIEYYTEALKINAIDKEAYMNRANLYSATGKLDLAAPDYKQALSIDPNYYLVLDNYAILLAMRGQYDSAMAFWARALKIHQIIFRLSTTVH